MDNDIWSEGKIQEHLRRLEIVSENARRRRDLMPRLISGTQIIIFNPNANKGGLTLKLEEGR